MLSSSPVYRKESEHQVHTTTCSTSYRQCVAKTWAHMLFPMSHSNCIQRASPSPVFSYATLMKSCLDYTPHYMLSISCSIPVPEKLFIPGFHNSKHLQLQSDIFERLQTQATTTAKVYSMKRI